MDRETVVRVALTFGEASEKAATTAIEALKRSRAYMKASIEMMDSIDGFDSDEGREARASGVEIMESCDRAIAFIEKEFDYQPEEKSASA